MVLVGPGNGITHNFAMVVIPIHSSKTVRHVSCFCDNSKHEGDCLAHLSLAS